MHIYVFIMMLKSLAIMKYANTHTNIVTENFLSSNNEHETINIIRFFI